MSSDRLYDLLPAAIRARDEQSGGALRAMLAAISGQIERVEGDIAQLYDNWFIETAEEWAVPYIADLLGVRLPRPVPGEDDSPDTSLRAYVANTLAYRRRKGTAAILEDLARDLTGWPSRGVEFFHLVQTSQNLNHRRPQAVSVSLRDRAALDRLDGAFETQVHTLDLRSSEDGRGRYHPRKAGLFLWRLRAYPLQNQPARRSTTHPYGYAFHPTGAPAPLFIRPQAQGAVGVTAGETQVPAPLRRLALGEDLEIYRAGFASKPPDQRPADSRFYGPNRSLVVRVNGLPLPPAEVIAWNLEQWERPPGTVEGLLSGDLSAFPALAGPPSLRVMIGDAGSRDLLLAAKPTTLEEARALLESALRAASAADGFARARVVAHLNRLFILPGVNGAAVQVAPTGSDAASAAALKLTAAAGATHQRGVFGAELDWLPGPLDAFPRVLCSMGAVADRLVSFAARPTSPAEARLLFENALRAASPDPAFTQAGVYRLGDRLLVLSGTPGSAPRFAPSPADRASFDLLGLHDRVAIDPLMGRLAFPIGAEPANPAAVRVDFCYGAQADLGGGAYPRLATPLPDGAQTFHAGGAKTLSQALTDWKNAGSRPAQILLDDAGPFDEAALSVVLPGSAFLSIRAAPGVFPLLRLASPASVAAPAEGAAFELDGVLVEGALELKGGLRFTARHATFLPGRGLDESGEPLAPAQPSLFAGSADAGEMQVTLERCISGPVLLPVEATRFSARDCILQAPPGSVVLGADLLNHPGPAAHLERCTLFGNVTVRLFELASECIFEGTVVALRAQAGCVRFCYFPAGMAQVPAPYRCQPDLALGLLADRTDLSAARKAEERARLLARVRPEFTSRRYPHPAYGQLSRSTPAELTAGAQDGSEMGAFHHLQQTLREANLRAALDEYTPLHIEPVLIFVS